MKKSKMHIFWAGMSCAAAVLVFSVMILVSAAAGDNVTATDPVVSLSYLEQVFKGELLTELNGNIQTELQTMDASLTKRISAVAGALKAPSAAAATHTAVTVPAGSSYSVSSGSEFLVVSGSAVVKEAGLTDVSAGISLSAGESLQENHLYVASGRVNLTGETAAQILIRK